MAQIKKTDIYEGGNPFEAVTDGIEKLTAKEKELIISNKALQESYANIAKTNDGKQARELVEVTEKLTVANKQLETVQKAKLTLTKAETDALIQLEKLKQAELNTAQKLDAAAKRAENDRKKAIKDTNVAADSIKGMSNRLGELRKAYDLLSESERKSKFGKNLKKEITGLDEVVKNSDASVGRFQRYVGQYGNALKGIAGKVTIFAGVIMGAVGAFNFFRDAMKKSASGASNFEYISGRLQTAFEKIQGKAGEAANFVSQLVLKSAELYGLITKSDEKIGEAQGTLNENRRDQLLINSKIQKQIAEINSEYEKQTAIAGDATITLKAQHDAEIKSNELNLKILELRLQMSEKAVEFSEKQKQITYDNNLDTQEAEIALNDAIIAREDIRKSIELQRIQSATRARQIEQDIFEQQLDFNLDIYDRNKTALEKQLTNEKLTTEEKLKLYEKLKEGSKINYEQNIELINKMLDTKLKADELEKISDEQKLLRILYNSGASEIVANRAREVLMENITFRQDVADAELALTKTVATETIAINDNLLDYYKAVSDTKKQDAADEAKYKADLIDWQAQQEIDAIERTQKAQEEKAQLIGDIYANLIVTVGDEFKTLIQDSEASLGDFLRATVNALIDSVEAAIVATQIKLILAQFEAGGTLNFAKLATATASLIGVKILAGGAKALISKTIPKDRKFADGGINIDGQGTGRSDSINAKLSAGESVISAYPTSKSIGLLTAINSNQLTDATAPQYFNTSTFESQQIVSKLDETNTLLRNGGFAFENDGFLNIQKFDGSLLKIKIDK